MPESDGGEYSRKKVLLLCVDYERRQKPAAAYTARAFTENTLAFAFVRVDGKRQRQKIGDSHSLSTQVHTSTHARTQHTDMIKRETHSRNNAQYPSKPRWRRWDVASSGIIGTRLAIVQQNDTKRRVRFKSARRTLTCSSLRRRLRRRLYTLLTPFSSTTSLPSFTVFHDRPRDFRRDSLVVRKDRDRDLRISHTLEHSPASRG